MNKKIKLCAMLFAMVVSVGVSDFVCANDDIKQIGESEIVSGEIKAGKETLEKAEAAINNKDYQSAIVYLTAYISAKPKKYEAYKLRGDAFYSLHQFKLAEYDYQKAIDLKTADDKFITNTKVLSAVVLGADKQSQYQNPELGNLYGRLMYTQMALNNPAYEVTYDKAFEYNSHIYLPKPKKEYISKINYPQKYGKILNPQGVDEYIMDTFAEFDAGQYHEAVYKIQYITENYPKYYFGHYLMGVAMVGLEQYDDAIHSFENALKYNPYDFETYASLGQLYYRKAEKFFSVDDAQKSIEYFTSAIKYNPNCNLYHYYIGLNHMITGDNDLAILSFDRAIKLKSNDYNSMYYKFVTQHIKGDYKSVIDGTTNLLYRHVSNYNSVMYLRALAYYKSGSLDSAITDLEKIHNNMNDIYNQDVQVFSKKEQTLSNYLYYLKAQILKDKGQGVKADLAKAYENPIIEELGKYKGKLSEDFRLSPNQIENEYDYIRTTFNQYNIGFEYVNSIYKIAKLESVDLSKNVASEQTLATDNSVVAQMLASNSFMEVASKIETVEQVAQEVAPVQEAVEETVEQVAQEVAPVQEVVEDTVEQVAQEVAPVQEVVEDTVEQVAQEVAPVQEVVDEPVEQVAQEVAPVQEVVEETVEQVAEEVAPVQEDVEGTVEQVAEEVAPVQEVVKSVPKVVEKHAQVDLSEFNTVQAKKVLYLKADDEIIEFEPETLADKVVPDKIKEVAAETKEFLENVQSDDMKKSQVAKTIQQEISKVEEVVQEVKTAPVDVNITPSEMTTKVVDSPVVVVPDVKIDVPEVEDKIVSDIESEIDNSDVGDVVSDVKNKTEEFVEIVSETVESQENIEDVSNDIAQNIAENTTEKKSWFGWFKRNRLDSQKEQDEVVSEAISVIQKDVEQVEEIVEDAVDVKDEAIVETKKDVLENVDDLASKVETVSEEVSETVENKTTSVDEIPLIRTTKAEISEEHNEIEVKEEKKNSIWWWKKDNTDEPSKVETEVKSKRIDWKKLFTREHKVKDDLDKIDE